MEASESNYVMVTPNRQRAESKATRTVVIILLLVSGLLTAVVAIGGFTALLQSFTQLFSYVTIAMFFVMAFYVYKWSRGVLALSAMMAVLLAVVAIIAAPGWFSRDQTGFDEPFVPAAILGVVCIVIVPVQLLLIGFAMRGFNQSWNIEVAVSPEEANENLAEKFDEGGRRIQHESDEEDVEHDADPEQSPSGETGGDDDSAGGGETAVADPTSGGGETDPETDEYQDAGADVSRGGGENADSR